MTAYPAAGDYYKAVQAPTRVFTVPKLQAAEFVWDNLGPTLARGSSAVVFQASVEGTPQALRCYIRDDATRRAGPRRSARREPDRGPVAAAPAAAGPRGAAGRALVGLGAGGPPPPSAGAKRAPAPDLSTYLASTFIAQCPRCGAFRLDIRRAPNGWDFRCEACECTWTWQPGTPWPPVRVMPRGRPPAP